MAARQDRPRLPPIHQDTDPPVNVRPFQDHSPLSDRTWPIKYCTVSEPCLVIDEGAQRTGVGVGERMYKSRGRGLSTGVSVIPKRLPSSLRPFSESFSTGCFSECPLSAWSLVSKEGSHHLSSSVEEGYHSPLSHTSAAFCLSWLLWRQGYPVCQC